MNAVAVTTQKNVDEATHPMLTDSSTFKGRTIDKSKPDHPLKSQRDDTSS